MGKGARVSLVREFESCGNWLFRFRSYLPLLLLILIVPLIPYHQDLAGSARYDLYWELACLAVSFFGLGIRIFTIGFTPANTSGRNTHGQVAEELNTKGIYSIVRHPLYLGNFFCWLGIMMLVHSWVVAALYTLIFWLYYERIMFAEEAFLTRKFGENYQAWAAQTPAFLPRFRKWQSSGVRFSLRNVIKREYGGCYAIVLSFAIIITALDSVPARELVLSPLWMLLLGSGSLLYIVIHLIKKKTRLLHVAGR